MGDVYCKLHLLANFASETNKVLKEFESLILHQNYSPEFVFATKESGVARHILIYLVRRRNHCNSVYWFNVLYYNATTVY